MLWLITAPAGIIRSVKYGIFFFTKTQYVAVDEKEESLRSLKINHHRTFFDYGRLPLSSPLHGDQQNDNDGLQSRGTAGAVPEWMTMLPQRHQYKLWQFLFLYEN
jgi:hypothetical protein